MKHPEFDLWTKLTFFYTNSFALTTLVLGLGIVGLYYISMIRKYNFPKNISLAPRQMPPRKLGPAFLRFIKLHDFDSDCLIVALLNATFSNCYRVKWGKNAFSVYLSHRNLFQTLNPEERATLSYSNGQLLEVLHVSAEKSRFSERAEDRMAEYLKTAGKEFLLPRVRLFVIGLILSVLMCIITVCIGGKPQYIIAILGFSTLVFPLMLGAPYILYLMYQQLRQWYILPASVLFFLFGFALAVALENKIEGSVLTLMIPYAILNVVLFFQLPYYTQAGNELYIEIEEFKMFLEERIEYEDKIGEDEVYLIPYLLALEVSFSNDEYFRPLLTSYKNRYK